MAVLRIRLALALVSMATIGLELALMRSLSLEYWHHFAGMVIGVALLGFGASGTALTLARERLERRGALKRLPALLCPLALAFAVSIPAVLACTQRIPVDVYFLSWNPGEAGRVLLVELAIFAPFLLAGAVIGAALMDRPERIGGHYAANLVGSGLGALFAVLAMTVLDVRGQFIALAVVAFVAGLVLVPWRTSAGRLAAAVAALLLVLAAALVPRELAVSQYKMLPMVMDVEGSRVVCRADGPLGRLDAVEGPALHYAPGLSLNYTGELPRQVLLLCDGVQTGAVYDCTRRGDWAFMDQTTRAAPYHLARDPFGRLTASGSATGPSALVIGAGGGADIGLALYHESGEVVALEMNPQVISMMTGPLLDRGGRVYTEPGVRVINREARGYLAGAGPPFDVIQLPPLDAFGASGAGLYAAQESYLYTVEAFEKLLDRLSAGGVLCVTRWARTPPRDELRVFDIAIAALRARRLAPADRLAMIRNWATVSVMVFKDAITAEQATALRRFCADRSFDLCYLPGLDAADANQFHVLDRPYYYEGAKALLGPDRERYLDDYLFDVRATTDDRPYFFHSFRWRSLPVLRRQLGARSSAFLELGSVMSAAALVQGLAAGALLIVLPLAARVRSLRAARRRAAVFAYFLLLGLGFMLLEIGFLQKLVLYLAHPIYSAAVVIAGFLVFSGLGSLTSTRWRAGPGRVIALAAAAVAGLSLAYLFVLDGWLGLTQAQAMGVRFAAACVTIAPLAFAMGHLFPAGLSEVGAAQPILVPWAWAVNGFASVVATVATPLLAAEVGFSRVLALAILCYAFAGVIARWLPKQTSQQGP